jgi:hypothetical protein
MISVPKELSDPNASSHAPGGATGAVTLGLTGFALGYEIGKGAENLNLKEQELEPMISKKVFGRRPFD